MEQLIYKLQNGDEIALLPNYFFSDSSNVLYSHSNVLYTHLELFYFQKAKLALYVDDKSIFDVLTKIDNDFICHRVELYFALAMVGNDIKIVRFNSEIKNIISQEYTRNKHNMFINRKLRVISKYNTNFKPIHKYINAVKSTSYKYSRFFDTKNDISCLRSTKKYHETIQSLRFPDKLAHFLEKISVSSNSSVVADVIREYSPADYGKLQRYLRIKKLKNII